MNDAILKMLKRYDCRTTSDYKNALIEIMQELALLGLWRSKFFEHAAFYGGTALRILYGLDRFSDDLDFSLLQPRPKFDLTPYLNAVESEIQGMGFVVTIELRKKKVRTAVDSAFIKLGTKESLFKVNVPQEITKTLHQNERLEIKLEVDTDPPPRFQTEAKTIIQPIPFSINAFALPDLFAGKIHAILQRKWNTRVKGRDSYDFIWYIGQKTPFRLIHLEQRLRQTGGWTGKNSLSLQSVIKLLEKKFIELNIDSAKMDVVNFIKDKNALSLWSPTFFVSLLKHLKAI